MVVSAGGRTDGQAHRAGRRAGRAQGVGQGVRAGPGPGRRAAQPDPHVSDHDRGAGAAGDWLASLGVTVVGMESTGVFWKPVYYLLEDQFECWLLNAQHLRNVPGRKTDVADAAWICQLVEHGLVRPSFVPPKPIRELRELTRYRKALIHERTREVQRLHKLLEDAGVKLGMVALEVLGVSGRAVLAALGEALEGRVARHHRLLVTELLAHIDYLDEAIERLSGEVAPFSPLLALLMTIPGVDRRTAEVILAEPGSRSALLRSGPLEPCMRLVGAHGSSKPRGRCGLACWHPARAGLELASAGGV